MHRGYRDALIERDRRRVIENAIKRANEGDKPLEVEPRVELADACITGTPTPKWLEDGYRPVEGKVTRNELAKRQLIRRLRSAQRR